MTFQLPNNVWASLPLFAGLLEVILESVQEFDPRIWAYAVAISMSAFVILTCTVCLLLLRDHYMELEQRRQQGNSFFL